MQIRVSYNDGCVLECMEVKDSRKFWRMVSKMIKYQRVHYNHNARVIKVQKGVKI